MGLFAIFNTSGGLQICHWHNLYSNNFLSYISIASSVSMSVIQVNYGVNKLVQILLDFLPRWVRHVGHLNGFAQDQMHGYLRGKAHQHGQCIKFHLTLAGLGQDNALRECLFAYTAHSPTCNFVQPYLVRHKSAPPSPHQQRDISQSLTYPLHSCSGDKGRAGSVPPAVHTHTRPSMHTVECRG